MRVSFVSHDGTSITTFPVTMNGGPKLHVGDVLDLIVSQTVIGLRSFKLLVLNKRDTWVLDEDDTLEYFYADKNGALDYLAKSLESAWTSHSMWQVVEVRD